MLAGGGRIRVLRLPEAVPQRLRDWVRGSSTGLVALSLLVGCGAGAGAVLFRYLILWFTRLFSGSDDYSGLGLVPNSLVPGLGIWFVVLAPVVGGLIYGPLIYRFAREARGHGVPEVMLAVAEHGGRIRPQVAIIKSLASALCIGSGGSVGREGPIVQIGSALGSAIGQAVKVPESRLRLLVACGAAGGISATFNAPIAGVVFALELILRDFQAESFGMVVLASVAANVIGRAAFGSGAFLSLPPFELTSYWEYLLYAVLGVVAALVGVAFIRVLYGLEDVADRIWRGPEWLRPGAGGVLFGLLLLAVPQMYGVGYPVLESAIDGKYVLGFLLLLLVAKIVATSLTIAIGGSGGVFAPSLFMGAMLGSAFGLVAHQLFPDITGPAGAYGLVGMGAVFAGATRAPLTAVIIIFELTGEYRIILPLMFAIVVAAGISNLVSKDTIYTLKLRRRGIDILRGRSANLMELLTVADAMRPVPAVLDSSAALDEVIASFADTEHDALPVADSQGEFRGVLTIGQVEEAVRDNTLDATAGDLALETPTIRPEQTLEATLERLVQYPGSGLPVVSPDGGRVVGWITHQDVLKAYAARLQRTLADVGSQDPIASNQKDSRGGRRLSRYRVVDLELAADGPPVGRLVADLELPASTALLALRRDGQILSPGEGSSLRKGDRLTMLVPSDRVDALADALRGTH